MSWQMKIAFGFHLVATLLIGGFGLYYIINAEFMYYHAAAVGMPWSAVPHPFQVLIHALMRALGIAGLAVVVLELFLLFKPFRQDALWARLAIPAGGVVISSGALYAMVYVLRNAPPIPPWTAKPPWILPLLGVVLFFAGLLPSLIGRKSAP
jgi:hypothetical protein